MLTQFEITILCSLAALFVVALVTCFVEPKTIEPKQRTSGHGTRRSAPVFMTMVLALVTMTFVTALGVAVAIEWSLI